MSWQFHYGERSPPPWMAIYRSESKSNGSRSSFRLMKRNSAIPSFGYRRIETPRDQLKKKQENQTKLETKPSARNNNANNSAECIPFICDVEERGQLFLVQRKRERGQLCFCLLFVGCLRFRIVGQSVSNWLSHDNSSSSSFPSFFVSFCHQLGLAANRRTLPTDDTKVIATLSVVG